MRKIHLIYWTLLSLIFGHCKEPGKEFSTFEVNPLKESIVKNKITAYLEYGLIDGKLEMGDSVSFDRQGNIISVINKGGLVNVRHLTYDSLNRLVFETQRSDIFNKLWTRYELNPESQTVVKYVSIGSKGDSVGKLIQKEFLKFDNYLNKILAKTIVNIDNDTTLIKYEYVGDQIKRESEEINGHKGRVTEYVYKNGKLAQIKRQYHEDFLRIDYVSQKTELIDSTRIKRQDDTMVKYYKYY